MTIRTFDFEEGDSGIVTELGDRNKRNFSIIDVGDGDHFTIDRSSGALSFTAVPDFENPQDSVWALWPVLKNGYNTYLVTVSYQPKVLGFWLPVPVIETVLIRVNDVDEGPQDLALDNRVVSENVAGAKVGELSATDPEGDAIEYSLSGDDADYFAISETTLTLKDGVVFDFEAKSVYNIIVTATSSGGAINQEFEIIVENVVEKPTDLTLADVEHGGSIETDEGIAGASIGTLSAKSPIGGDIKYELSGADAVFFEVVDENGGKRVKLLDTVTPNFESSKTSYDLTVTASSGGEETSADFTITVLDINEPPRGVDVYPPKGEGSEGGEGEKIISFPENTSIKTELAHVDVYGDPDDYDAFPPYIYELSDDRFEVDGGKLYLKPGQSTDFETEPEIRLTLTVHDGEFEVSTEVVVLVTDVAESDSGGGGGGTPNPGPDTPTPTPNDFDGFIPALVVSSFVQGEIPDTMPRLESLANFAESQFLSYQERGVADPALGPYEALGLGFAETTEFQDKYGALTESAFITEAYEDVFGRQATSAQADHFQAQIDYFEALYASVGIAEDKAEMMAKGAALGQMLGFAVLEESETQPYLAQAQAFLADAADGVVEMGKPLAFYELN